VDFGKNLFERYWNSCESRAAAREFFSFFCFVEGGAHSCESFLKLARLSKLRTFSLNIDAYCVARHRPIFLLLHFLMKCVYPKFGSTKVAKYL